MGSGVGVQSSGVRVEGVEIKVSGLELTVFRAPWGCVWRHVAWKAGMDLVGVRSVVVVISGGARVACQIDR